MSTSTRRRRSRSRPRRKTSRRRGGGLLSLVWRLPRWARWLGVIVALGAGVLEGRESEWLRPVAVPYSRDLYAHWLDTDGDCLDTRQEILARDSVIRPTFSADGCRVTGGRWRDPYTGRTFTDPSALDVDHIVPLSEAHRSGADRWEPARRAAFANNPGNLIAVSASANRSKADGDPLAWLPPAWPYRCAYTAHFAGTKQDWGLEQDPLERWFTAGVRWVCG
ncbi:HNH endonuclease family protein [Caenispirillum salinarum]|uniref:HNH endonuclease family protein n=1 Tax=Caenispirillum salinarum TaxID=859058 RepID=UPI00384CF71D